MKRGELMFNILNIVEDKIMPFVDLHSVIITSSYGTSSNKINKKLSALNQNRVNNKKRKIKEQESRIRLQKYISKLKSSGLLYKEGATLKITKEGKKKLGVLRKNLLKDISVCASKRAVIISYDFPVKHRRLRNRIREILRMFDFEMIHQSLWLGKIKITKDFLNYLETIGALEYMHILEVTKEGSLSKLN